MPANPLIKNTLLTTIVFLKHKAEDNNLNPVITVTKLIDLLKAGGLNITYQQLADFAKDPLIAPSIKSINKNQVELTLGDEEAPVQTPPPIEQPQQAQQAQLAVQQAVQPEEMGEEEYNPEDFAAPENDEEEQTEENADNEVANETPRNKESTVSQMAKRALNRAD
jgi:hypothetical protein